jgi:RNA 3'-terminal phosphate cyclase (ATP)
MTKPLYIDGSHGEGGGQILRTSLTLAAMTEQSVRIDRIRAKRKNPGLAPQHLTAVRAVAAICDARVTGDDPGSTTLEFTPTRTPKAGRYTFDVTEATGAGSAGAVTLILQAILLPLAFADGSSTAILKGGTHVAWSPPATYIDRVYLPLLRQLGLDVQITLAAWGWYPRGGGEVQLQVRGQTTSLGNLDLLDRGDLQQVTGVAAVTELPSHIPQRMAARANNLLRQSKFPGQIQPLRERGVAPGAGIFLVAEYDRALAGFSALGRPGLPSNRVAEIAFAQLQEFHDSDAPVDLHLADQLLLPLALAAQPSRYRVARVTPHLITNAEAISQFGVANVAISTDTCIVMVTPTE